ncbi:MAG: serine/threonine-protein kinase [Pseudomonadota bacterium]
MAGSFDDRLRTGGAFDALPDRETLLENKLRGRVLSGYEVGEVVGVGGMGYVLLATRAEGDFDRVAAIKVVAATHDTSELAQRFRREVQIHANLNHASIAQLYDAGETEEGWPYLVMEYVDGRPIDEYCAHGDLGLEDRVRLLMDVADAVQFAHSRLVVHRDLKPSNVLVDSSGRLKLLDFGIAKLLGDGSENLTRAGAMTPRYASPEQLLGQPITVASDVYQLGLLMAEVLGGELPTAEETLTEAIQRSAEGRLLTLPSSLRQTLPAELVLIIEQCLRTEPADRYRDTNYLRDDLEAYLTGYPVSAAGQRSGYRLRKFVRRNWGGVLSATLTLLALVTATIVTAVQTVEAKRQRDIALYQQQRVEASNEFYSLLLEEMGDGSFTSIDLLDRGTALLDDQFGSGQPFMASVLFDVSKRYENLGERDQQRALLSEAERIARDYADDNQLAAVLCAMARTNRMADPELAAGQLADGLALYEALPAPSIETSMECLQAQSGAEVSAGNFEAALVPLFAAKQLLDEHPAPGTRLRGLLLDEIGYAYFYDGQTSEAIKYLDEGLQLLESSGRGNTRLYQRSAANKAVSLGVLGRAPEALAVFADLRERMQSSGFKDRGAAIHLVQHGDLLINVERPDEAAAIYAEGLEIAEAVGYSRITAALKLGLAKASIDQGAFAAAQQNLEAAGEFVFDGEPKPLALGIRIQQTRLQRLTGQLDLAADSINAVLTDLGYPDSRRRSGLISALLEGAEIYRQMKDYARARVFADALVEGIEEQRNAASKPSLILGKSLLQRGQIRLEAGDRPGAEADLRAALPHLAYGLGAAHEKTMRARRLLAEARQAPEA